MDTIGVPIPVEVTPEIIDLGRFAVDEHNKKEHTCLEFKKVWSAERQLVKGYNYYLTLEAANEGKDNLYEATVYVSWENNEKELTEFNIVRPTPGGIHPVDITPKLIGLARFAVEEHNKKEHTLLEFKKLLSAKEQAVQGYNYYLNLGAADGGIDYVYEAKVFVSLENVKEVKEFKLVGADGSS
ncbi:UNVERIFIED_CONTAM: Multicystatin [Sesamum calycinum]|uniref:Cysteine proteinase inhibitor n=1 Tax=Sesamum calycinum TaxID=2727403 RepID=A0AAW2SDT7_9LAMI